ncbi:MAG: hypothetical protein JF615_00330 [Asticcacaulis sp.]|nr:hypothetical protein [Asticcacaulis sp.]
MTLMLGLFLLALGAVLGYLYFPYGRHTHQYLAADQDLIDCQADAGGKSASNKDLAACYIDKKSKRIKEHLQITD